MLLKAREVILLHELDSEDEPGTFIDANEAAIELLGYSRDELMTLMPENLLAPEQAWELPVVFQNLAIQQRASIEVSLQKKDGGFLPVEISAHTFQLDGKRMVFWNILDIEETRHLEQAEEVLATLAHRLSSASTPTEAAEAILETADEIFEWDAAYLNLYSQDKPGTYPVINIDTVNGRKVRFPSSPLNEPMSPTNKKVMEEGSLLYYMEDLPPEQTKALTTFGSQDQNSQTAMYVPIRKATVSFGVLSLQSYRQRAFSERDLQLLQIMADHCAAALDRTMAEAWMRQHAFLSRKFAELGKSLAGASTPEEASQVILTTARDLFGWDAAFVFAYEEPRDFFATVLAYDTIDGETQKLEISDLGKSLMFRKVISEGGQLVLRNSSRTEKPPLKIRLGSSKCSNSLMYVPLRISGDPIGILSIQSYELNAYSQEALEQLQALADHCAGALSRAMAQQELRLSEARLRLVTGQLPALLWTIDDEMRVTMFLGDVTRNLQLDEKMVVGKSLKDLLPPKAIDAVVTSHERALAGESDTYEIEWSGFVLHCYVEPLRDDAGAVIGCINVAHNITERKHAELALKQAHEELEHRVEERTAELTRSNAQLKLEISERKKTEDQLERSLSLLRATLESTTDGIVAVNHQGQIEQYNQKWLRIWNFEQTNGSDKKVALESVILPKLKDPDTFKSLLTTSYEAREAEFFEIIELLDGRVLEVYSKVQRINIKSVGRVWSFRDVTLRRLAERALVQSELNYREAIENASGVPYRLVYETDDYEFMGEGIKQLLGISSSAFVPETLAQYLQESVILEDQPWTLEDYVTAFRNGQLDCYRVDLRVKLPDGSEKWINDSSVPIRDEKTGQVIGSLGIMQDITPRKRQEEIHLQRQERLNQAEKLIALGTLVSGVAHEINNPNNFIMLNTPILQEAWEDITPVLDSYHGSDGDFIVAGLNYSEMRDHVPDLFKGISQGAIRIKNIIQELRDFARPQSESCKEQVELNAVVNSALILLQNLIRNSTNNFKVQLAPNLPPVIGNFQRLEQVVINLIQNACEALSNTQSSIMVSTLISTKGDILLIVRDEGCGISKEDLKYIMDPFFTTKRERGGTGLGLSITTNIVHDHNGMLEIKSERGRGTTATLRFPITRLESRELEKTAFT